MWNLSEKLLCRRDNPKHLDDVWPQIIARDTQFRFKIYQILIENLCPKGYDFDFLKTESLKTAKNASTSSICGVSSQRKISLKE